LIGGFVFGSLALLADGAHMASDVLALSVALVALNLARRPASERHTYGLARAEVLGAQVNGVLLLAGAGAVFVEAVRRLDDPPQIDAFGVVVVGALGLLVNVVSAVAVGHVSHGDLGMRAAFWHLTADAFGSVAVLASAFSALAFDAYRVDAVASIVIAVLVLFAAWRLLRDTTRVLLEAVPEGIDIAALRAELERAEGVEAVHDLHVWSVGSSHAALSAHVVLAGPLSLHDAQERSRRLKSMLVERFGITHATLEVECHECVDEQSSYHP
jgi:cobalt-zinc-cadmium efflux system protein